VPNRRSPRRRSVAGASRSGCARRVRPDCRPRNPIFRTARVYTKGGFGVLRTTPVSQPLLARLEPLERVTVAVSAAPCEVCKRRWSWNGAYRFEVCFHNLFRNVVASLVRRDHVRRATPGCTQTLEGCRIQPQGQLACIRKRGPCCRVGNREPASQASYIAAYEVSVCRAPQCLIARAVPLMVSGKPVEKAAAGRDGRFVTPPDSPVAGTRS
jgi:hypothetical protein